MKKMDVIKQIGGDKVIELPYSRALDIEIWKKPQRLSLIDTLRRGYPQTTTFDKVVYDDGRVFYCGRGWLIQVWEEETGNQFPYKSYRNKQELANVYAFWNIEKTHTFFKDNVLPYYGATEDLIHIIIDMNDRGKTPAEIADYLEGKI